MWFVSSAWTTPIVVVQKLDREVRIYADIMK